MSASATAPDAVMRLCLSEMLRRLEDRTAWATMVGTHNEISVCKEI